jgi:phosphoribosyl-ATP pyrophosphohydrolase
MVFDPAPEEVHPLPRPLRKKTLAALVAIPSKPVSKKQKSVRLAKYLGAAPVTKRVAELKVPIIPKAASPKTSVPVASPVVLDDLWTTIMSRRTADPAISHSARLLSRGTVKVAQKFGEEAVECLIEVVAGNRTAAIGESADVLYHLLVMWVEAGIRPEEIWTELEKRKGASNLIEGPQGPIKRLIRSVNLKTTKIP